MTLENSSRETLLNYPDGINVEKYFVSLSVVGVNTHGDIANVRLPLSRKKAFQKANASDVTTD